MNRPSLEGRRFGAVIANGLLLLSAILATAGLANVVTAQRTPSGCAAGGCEIVLEKVASLSEGKDTGILLRAPAVVRSRSGHWFTLASNLREIVVFSPSGTVLKRLAGLSRGGVVLAGQDDTVYVYDPTARLLYRVENLELAASSLRVLNTPDLLLKDGSMIVAEQIRSSELVGYPLHALAPDGQLRRSFGTDQPVYRPDLPRLMNRVVAPDPNGNVWASPPGRYVLQLWSPSTGALLKSLTVTSSWFVDSDAPPPDFGTRPKPAINAIWNINDVIWVLVRDADANWVPVPNPPEERGVPLAEINARFDWVLEAIDPASGGVIASRRFPRALAGYAPQPFLTLESEVSTGAGRVIDVWRPILRQKAQE